MDAWYDLHSWSKQCREEALRETRNRHLAEQANAKYSLRLEWAIANTTWRSLVSLLRRVGLWG
jgi:hypothetical protein